MIKKVGPAALAVVAGSSLMAGSAFAAVPAASQDAFEANADAPSIVATNGTEVVVRGIAEQLTQVMGTFSFNQSELSSNDELAYMAKASKYLCKSDGMADGSDQMVDPMQWKISVGGEVSHPLIATMEELADGHSSRLVMGCVCYGNPAGGLSIGNAMVKGIELASLEEAVGVSEAANTIVIGCNDGYEVALPLSYLRNRYSMVVYEANGSELADSIGGTNQLWLGSSAGNYFARDITSIRYETREEAPPIPYTDEGDDYYARFPGVGITSVR